MVNLSFVIKMESNWRSYRKNCRIRRDYLIRSIVNLIEELKLKVNILVIVLLLSSSSSFLGVTFNLLSESYAFLLIHASIP